MSDLPVPLLIADLLKPEAYPHEVDEIKVRQTHISWVLLTGRFAYKIKKPVHLGFLDFSTLDLRHHFCEEEIRLNRRYSTDLYLDTVSVVETAAGPQIEQSGTPVEYAVRMRQFDEQDLAGHLLADEKLSPTLCDELSTMVAAMHESADRADDRKWGSQDQVMGPVTENFDELRSLIKESASLRQLKELESWSYASAERLNSTFEFRRRHGYVRECHGDLHLGNIVHWRGAMTPFDCIEFNESFRMIDVLNEVAFLVMDLDDHLRTDLGSRFLNGYLELTGDYENLSVLPFYLAYRAVVRAKVHAIRGHQPGLSRLESERLHQESHNYLCLAHRYTQPTPVTLTITNGVSGSGKTTGTQRLIDHQRSIRLRSDVERKRLYGLRPQDHATATVENGIYSPAINRETYDRLFSVAQAILRSGFSVIVDATFLKCSERERFRSLAAKLGVPFQILPFHADIQTLRNRIHTRSCQESNASDATIAVLEHQLQTMESLTEEELQFVISPAGPDTEPESTTDN